MDGKARAVRTLAGITSDSGDCKDGEHLSWCNGPGMPEDQWPDHDIYDAQGGKVVAICVKE